MNDQSIARTQLSGYHAHVYYDAETKPIAERLAAAMGDQFNVRFGGFHDGPVGRIRSPTSRSFLPPTSSRRWFRG